MTPEPTSPAGTAASGPLVSVVIPCYNQALYLPEAIESAFRQSYRPLEIVVIDDGSTDETSKVSAAYPSVRYISQVNAGLAAARNRGIRESTGDFLLFLDADDRLLPGAIEQGVRAMFDHPGCGFVYGKFRFVNEQGRVLETYDAPPDNPDTYLGLFGGNHIAMCAAVLFPRATLERAGGFRPELSASEDYDLYFRIARLYPYFRHDAIMAECRRHGSNMSLNASLMLRNTLRVVRAQREYLGKDAEQRRLYRKSRRIWTDYYGGLLIKQVKSRLAEHEFLRAGKETVVLLRWAPATLVRAVLRRLRALTRRPSAPGAFRRLTPVSRDFGYDRGTPIDRYYLERALASCAQDIRGHVLEVKDDAYTRRFGGARVVKSDVLDIAADNPHATIQADLAGAPQIASGTFDCIVITQTLHLIYDLHAAVQTLHRILKPGGTVLATVPGISQIAFDGWNRWNDQWRFTTASARRMFEDVFGAARVTVSAYGNLCTAVNFLDGRVAEELGGRELDYADSGYELVIFVRAVKS